MKARVGLGKEPTMHGSAKFSTCGVCFRQFRVQCDLDDPKSVQSATASAAAQARECAHDEGVNV